MRQFINIFFALYLLTGCTYQPKEKRLPQSSNNNSQIVETFYKTANDTIYFNRILTDKSELILQRGQIFLGEYGLTHQQFIEVNRLLNERNIIDSLIGSFVKEGLKTKLSDEREVMFVQIIPDSTMSNLEALGFLNLRHKVEGRIDERLKGINSGEWFAGDMGAGGNMLFFVDDWEEANQVVLQVLKEEDLLEHALISKRIMTAKDDWNYEIVYPVAYEGIFNQM